MSCRLFALLTAAALLAPACGEEVTPLPTCAADADCPLGNYCGPRGICTFDCRTHAECPVGSRCDRTGRCRRAADAGVDAGAGDAVADAPPPDAPADTALWPDAPPPDAPADAVVRWDAPRPDAPPRPDAAPLPDLAPGDLFVYPDGVARRCDPAIVGRPCRRNADCGGPMVCLVVARSGIGFCTCQNCRQDDPRTATVEDDCPGYPTNVCGTALLAGGVRRTVCYRACRPRIGGTDCARPFACDPASGVISGLTSPPVCVRIGCNRDADCPVVTATPCDTASPAGRCKKAGQVCVTQSPTTTKGRCADPGRCDRVSGLCAPRTSGFKATARVGDPCGSDHDCGRAMRCEREADPKVLGLKASGTCTTGAECCSGVCAGGRCALGPCVPVARNGYCTIAGCAAAATLKHAACPAGSVCSRIFFGGLCFKGCSITDPKSCRGNAADRFGDYECRDWTRLAVGGVQVARAPTCEWGRVARCALFSGATGISCATLGGPTNPRRMRCRDPVSGKDRPSATDALGYCLDDSASGKP